MNKRFVFDCDGIDNLRASIGNGLQGYSTISKSSGRIDRLWLFLSNETLEVTAEINQIEPNGWEEVGTLCFRRVLNENIICNQIKLSDSWTVLDSISRLELYGENFIAESGILLKNKLGEDLYIIAGALPLTIEIKAPFYESDFQPEYNLDEYSIIPI